MELKDFRITKAKLGVMLMCVMIIIAASQLSPLFSTAGQNPQKKETLNPENLNPVRELSFDESSDVFTIKDRLTEPGGYPGGSSYTGAPNKMGTPKIGIPGLGSSGDSLIFENDSTFTIEGIKEELSKDGDWINVTAAEVDPQGVVDNSGGFDNEINTDYIWRPRGVPSGWSPYTNGWWNYTNCGWMWNSNYSWGWRPYHYGRWWFSEIYGWVWSPGFIFAPAWVSWMYNDDYYGWYPISPRIRCHHYNRGHNWGYRCHNMRYRVRHWNFCHKKDFANPLHPPVLVVDPSYNGGIIKTTKYDGVLNVNNDGVKSKGPDVNDIEKYGGVKIKTEDITKYGTKVVTVSVNDGTKKNDDVSSVKEYNGTKNDGTKDNGGTKQENTTKQEQNTTKQEQNTTKENNTIKHEQNTGREDKNNDTKRDDNSKKRDDNSKNNDGTKQKDTYTPPVKKETQKKDAYEMRRKENEEPKEEEPMKEESRKEEPKKEEQKKEEPMKEKDDYTPKKNNPPPVKETYTPPKDDNSKD